MSRLFVPTPWWAMLILCAVSNALAQAPAPAPAPAPAISHLDCVADVYPPYTVETGGVVSGLGADLLVEAGRRTGLDIVVKILPFARIENELKRAGASSVACAYAFSRTPEREAYMLFSNVPLSVTSYVLYARTGKTHGVYAGVQALQGTRIGVRLAFRVPDALKQAAERGELTLEPVNDDELNFRKLALGRLDYVLINQDVGETLLRRLQLSDIKAMRPAVAEFPTYVVFNKGLEQAVAWRNAVDRGILATRAPHPGRALK
jgi:polar amino acid transport system substrate-binding protein